MIGSFALVSTNRKTTRITTPTMISPPTSGSVQFASWPELLTLPLLVRPSMKGTTPAVKRAMPEIVEVADRRLPAAGAGQHGRQHDQGSDPERHVDVEDPVPADVVGDPAADERPDDEAQAEDGAEQALEASALARAVEVADDRDHDREERARAQALDGPERDQLGHVLRGA